MWYVKTTSESISFHPSHSLLFSLTLKVPDLCTSSTKCPSFSTSSLSTSRFSFTLYFSQILTLCILREQAMAALNLAQNENLSSPVLANDKGRSTLIFLRTNCSITRPQRNVPDPTLRSSLGRLFSSIVALARAKPLSTCAIHLFWLVIHHEFVFSSCLCFPDHNTIFIDRNKFCYAL